MKTAYKIGCPHCKQHLEYDEELFGLVVDCPACTGKFKIPTPQEKSDLESWIKYTERENRNSTPLNAPHKDTSSDHVQLIEKTSKPLKLQYAISLGLFFASGTIIPLILMFICGLFDTSTILCTWLGWIIFVGSIIWHLVTRVRMWWHHG